MCDPGGRCVWAMQGRREASPSAGCGGRRLRVWVWMLAVFLLLAGGTGRAQENPLSDANTPIGTTPKPATPPDATNPADPKKSTNPANPADSPPVANKGHRPPSIHMDVNLVLVPMTVTDPMNRLVTGLEKENFAIFDNNQGQTIKTFSTEDAPVTVGIVFDLSGSMTSKYGRARKALSEFMRTSNPQDEFFVIGFNDRPAVVVDYTSDVDDVDARMAMLKPENRTALIDAVYLGVNKLKMAKYDRKALLIISDGGDNRSRYSENELRRVVRESDVQVYAIGIFDTYAPTIEEQTGPILLNDICETSGGRMFRVAEAGDMGDIASRISAELRNEYVIGYRPSEVKRDGNWRKLKVRLMPPPGLPNLDVHYRQGYYAPSQ
jgi:Ca-activated chloride channel family protein